MIVNIFELPNVYINLDRDVDKNISMLQMFKRLGIKDFSRVRAFVGQVIGPEKRKNLNPYYATACVKSVIKSLSVVKAPFVVLEDDVVLDLNWERGNSLSIPEDADVVYLGGSRFGILSLDSNMDDGVDNKYFDRYDQNLVIPNGMLRSHALLILNENAKYKLIKNLTDNLFTIQDITMAKMQIKKELNFYAIDPPIYYQDGIDDTYSPYPDNLFLANNHE